MVDYSRKDVILVKDLGIIDGSRKGLYECNICGDHVIKFTANANKGSCRCQQCSKLKPLEGLPLQLVEDLGMVFINEHSSRKTRMCVVTCPICDASYTVSANDVKSGKSSMCRKCSLSLSGWSDSEWETRGKNSSNFDGYKVYVVKMTSGNEEFYKIGKTYTTTKGRYSRESAEFPYDVEVLYEYTNDSGVRISKVERMLHKALKTVRYEPTIEFCGKTECFSSVDIEQIKDIIEEMEV